MNYPDLNPVAISVGPIEIRWYGISYAVAFILCYLLGRYRTRTNGTLSVNQWNDVLIWGILGTLLGGRLGFIIFYSWDLFVTDPLVVFRVWEGGMSFHGGLIGVTIAIFIWSKLKGLVFVKVIDFVAPVVPIGVGIGRLGNFMNTELPGRVTESFLGVHFPCSAVDQINLTCVGDYETVTRHVSSLYQALTTGVIVFVMLWWFSAKPRARGQVSGMFALLYGSGRFVTEFFREPDYFLGFVIGNWLTMGQLLSLPLILLGLFLLTPPVNKFLEQKNL